MLTLAACTDLDLEPQSSLTSDNAFASPDAYQAFLARVYAGLSVSGQQGPSGDPDIKGIDEGFSNYLRQYWKAQELTTDEAVIGWSDAGLSDYHDHDWTAANQFITALYNRVFYQISISNEFLQETTDEKLDSRAVGEPLRTQIRRFRAEARFLRALSYWHALDLFGPVPFYTETHPHGEAPDQASRQDVFAFVERELLAIEADLYAPRQGPYGRADRAAAWTLLAKLYLNAEVYTGQPRYGDCRVVCEQILGAGVYALTPVYLHLFRADNHTSPEIIFPITFDGLHTQTFGGMTFLTHAAVGGRMDAADYGIDGGWWGLRTTRALVERFPGGSATADGRATFYTDGQTLEIDALSDFTQGYALPKFTNRTAAGAAGSHATFPDTDFPFFRLADVYLMYAEAVVRGGGGDRVRALAYVNQLRERAYGTTEGTLTEADLTLAFLLDERSRELYWEGQRRTDLIRFGQFTTHGRWPWKGGVKEGKPTEAFRELFPLPASELLANPKLIQNPHY